MKNALLLLLFDSTFQETENIDLGKQRNWVYGDLTKLELDVCDSNDRNCFDQCNQQINQDTSFNKCIQVSFTYLVY